MPATAGCLGCKHAFYGVGAAVIGIIGYSAYKLTRKSIGKDWLLWGIYATALIVTVATATEYVWLFLAAGVLVWFVRCPPRWRRPEVTAARRVPLDPLFAAAQAFNATLLGEVFVFFAKAGTFVFGSGLAIVPFLYGGVVKEHGWLNDQQFVDAVAVAMITPGPVVITVGFIGYLVAGFWARS